MLNFEFMINFLLLEITLMMFGQLCLCLTKRLIQIVFFVCFFMIIRFNKKLITRNKVTQYNWVNCLYYEIIYLDAYLFLNFLI
jgi:hypothetical protein